MGARGVERVAAWGDCGLLGLEERAWRRRWFGFPLWEVRIV